MAACRAKRADRVGRWGAEVRAVPEVGLHPAAASHPDKDPSMQQRHRLRNSWCWLAAGGGGGLFSLGVGAGAGAGDGGGVAVVWWVGALSRGDVLQDLTFSRSGPEVQGRKSSRLPFLSSANS